MSQLEEAARSLKRFLSGLSAEDRSAYAYGTQVLPADQYRNLEIVLAASRDQSSVPPYQWANAVGRAADSFILMGFLSKASAHHPDFKPQNGMHAALA